MSILWRTAAEINGIDLVFIGIGPPFGAFARRAHVVHSRQCKGICNAHLPSTIHVLCNPTGETVVLLLPWQG
jgi:hypothetical protein